jgi:hypothetical protein
MGLLWSLVIASLVISSLPSPYPCASVPHLWLMNLLCALCVLCGCISRPYSCPFVLISGHPLPAALYSRELAA